MKSNMPINRALGLKYSANGICFLLLTCFTTYAQAGMFDELINKTKESFTDLIETTKDDLETGTKEISDDVTEQISTTTNDAEDSISESVSSAVNSATQALNGNKNRIMNLQLEGIVVGSKPSSAENTLTQAGYKKLSANPWQFQKAGKLLKFSTTNGMISSIELNGAVAGETFIDKERSRIESTLGKACPPASARGTWFCNLEGDDNEYYLELKVRRNKFSYLVEGDI